MGLKPVIASVEPDSIAQQADIQPGSEIIAVNGKKTPTWQAVTYALVDQYGQPGVMLTIKPDATSYTQEKQLDLRTWVLSRDDASLYWVWAIRKLLFVKKLTEFSMAGCTASWLVSR